jgi:hypothetical protein
MAEGISTGLTRAPAAQGRRFGFTVGPAFFLLAAIALWRGKTTASTVFGVLGTLLVIGAAAMPAHLVPVERAWMKMAFAISKVTTPIFMGVVWFFVVTPTGVIRRALGKNQIARQPNAATYWVERPVGKRQGNLERQF